MTTISILLDKVYQGCSIKTFKGSVVRLSMILDRAAGFCMVAIMVLVLSNVILRSIFNRPILGAYEYVGFLTAVMIGLALAYCAVQKGHIAVDFVMARFSPRIQAAVDIVTCSIALGFWTLSAWHVAKHAYRLSVTGVVASTTQTPYYHFIYLLAFGLLVLGLVLLLELIESIKKAAVSG